MERIHPPARFAGPSLFEGTPMHFFYLDETGCTGGDLTNVERPIFVIGGISVTDEGWRTTSDRFLDALENFFGGNDRFELHATDLVNGQGHFAALSRERRHAFAHTLLDAIAERTHALGWRSGSYRLYAIVPQRL
jgi:hypothetical protein